MFGLCGCVERGFFKKIIKLMLFFDIIVLICWFLFNGFDLK